MCKNLDAPMTTDEAFALAKTYGETVVVEHSIQTHPDEEISDFSYYRVVIDNTVRFTSSDGYESIFDNIDKVDIKSAKETKLAELREEIASLEALA